MAPKLSTYIYLSTVFEDIMVHGFQATQVGGGYYLRQAFRSLILTNRKESATFEPISTRYLFIFRDCLVESKQKIITIVGKVIS